MEKVIRIDKNLALNTLDFRVFGKDVHYARMLMYYICDQYFRHPENFGRIYVQDFCKAMGVSYARMRQAHENPQHLIDLKTKAISTGGPEEPIDKDMVFKTNFENLLYNLNQVVFQYSYGGLTSDKYKFIKVQSGTLLRSIGIEYHSSKTNKRKYHTFELDPQIINNLSKWYNDLNAKALIELADYQELLSYLYNLKDMYNRPGFKGEKVMYYELLCKLVNTNCSAFKDNKKAINKAFKKIQEKDKTLSLALYKWVKGRKTDNVATDVYIDFNYQPVDDQAKFNNMHELFDVRLIYDLKNYFRAAYKENTFPQVSTENEILSFKSWWKGPLDLDIKSEYYQKTKRYIYGEDVALMDREAELFFKSRLTKKTDIPTSPE